MSDHPPIVFDESVLRVGAWVRMVDRVGRPKATIVHLKPRCIVIDLNGEHLTVRPDQIELLPAMRGRSSLS
jgi:hypothetical protein